MKKNIDTRIKPIEIETKFGLIGYIILIGALIGVFIKWDDFMKFFFINGTWLNWRVLTLSHAILALTIGYILNHFWRKEYMKHTESLMDLENLRKELRISEHQRLTDVVTGVPNSRRLMQDFDQGYIKTASKKMQFILIDIKNFREINKKFKQTKTNHLLRFIGQTIYKSMRRNEDMYKFSDGNMSESEISYGNFYRLYPGGDEFAFIIEGDQAEALGFANRLRKQFLELSGNTENIIGEIVNLSFHCGVVEMDPRDTYGDIFTKADDCYQIAKDGTKEFNICWHPTNIEGRLSLEKRV